MRNSQLGRLCAAAAGLLVTSAVPLNAADASTALTPTITTAVSPAGGGPVGTTISDTATLNGFVSPTGTLNFNLYGPDDTTCMTTPVSTSSSSVTGSTTTLTSTPFTPSAPGTYRFLVTYTGDTGNTPTQPVCGAASETVTITPPPPAVPGGPPCTPGTPNVYGNGNADGTYGNLGHGNQGNCNVGDGNEGDLNDGNGSATNPPEDE
ncbi:MAG TPA: hypothetical protein VHV82_02680 [Sporichthyaceae bacterium]|jgi:hypothetical protein|nr:hypothetical protein [Sporichthyaceae bacterium]